MGRRPKPDQAKVQSLAFCGLLFLVVAINSGCRGDEDVNDYSDYDDDYGDPVYTPTPVEFTSNSAEKWTNHPNLVENFDTIETAASCPALPDILGMEFICHYNGPISTCQGPQKSGTDAYLTCHRPYFIPDDLVTVAPLITCQPNGTWSKVLGAKDRRCRWDCGSNKDQMLHTPPSDVVNGIQAEWYRRSRAYLSIGGTIVKTQAQWPWHATLYREIAGRKLVNCGGTLIAPNIVLTAAHCVVEGDIYGTPLKPADIEVFFGKNVSAYAHWDKNTQTVPIKAIHKQEDYAPQEYQSDIALIVLEHPVTLTDFVRPACIPTDEDLTKMVLHQARPGGNITGTTVGFGIDETLSMFGSKFLRQLEAPIVSNKECKDLIRRGLKEIYHTKPIEICSGRPKDRAALCKGDSGGGLVLPQVSFGEGSGGLIRYFVHGVMSHGPDKGDLNDPCNTWTYKVFTKVQSYNGWIREVLKEHPAIWLSDDKKVLSTSHTLLGHFEKPKEGADTTNAAMGEKNLCIEFFLVSLFYLIVYVS